MLGGFGVGDAFLDAGSVIGEWFGSSPFGGMLPHGDNSKAVAVVLYPSNVTIDTEGDVIIETNTVNFTEFNGALHFDSEGNVLSLKPKAGGFSAVVPRRNVHINGLKLSKLSLNGIRFVIEPNMTTSNGTITLENFVGNATVDNGMLVLTGNVTRLNAIVGGIEWEMK